MTTSNFARETYTQEVDELHPTLVRMARTIHRLWPSGSVDALDLAQEGVIAAMQCTRTYDPSRGPFRHYALRSASFRMQEAARGGVVLFGARATSRHEGRVVAQCQSMDGNVLRMLPATGDQYAAVETAHDLGLLLARLDEEAAEVITMRHGLGDIGRHSTAEIAAVTGLSTRQVEQATQRGMRKLRRAALQSAA